MTRYFFEIAYNGSAFNGWQRQQNTSNTIQEKIEDHLYTLRQAETPVISCGRTDKGVHARSFYFHIDAQLDDTEALLYKLNRMSGPDLYFKRAFPVPMNVHARFSARERRYDYYFHIGKNVFIDRFSHSLDEMPDLGRIQKALDLLPLYEDYRAFCKSPDKHESTICKIKETPFCEVLGKERFTIRIRANRFLKSMIRILLYRVIEIGHGRMQMEEFEDYLVNRNFNPDYKMLPPNGLFLSSVYYDLPEAL